MKQIRKSRKQKRVRKPNSFVSGINPWCGIKNDYRTLISLEDVNLVDMHTAIDEDEDDEQSTPQTVAA